MALAEFRTAAGRTTVTSTDSPAPMSVGMTTMTSPTPWDGPHTSHQATTRIPGTFQTTHATPSPGAMPLPAVPTITESLTDGLRGVHARLDECSARQERDEAFRTKLVESIHNFNEQLRLMAEQLDVVQVRIAVRLLG